jgi:hypothetical protein
MSESNWDLLNDWDPAAEAGDRFWAALHEAKERADRCHSEDRPHSVAAAADFYEAVLSHIAFVVEGGGIEFLGADDNGVIIHLSLSLWKGDG